MPQAISTRKVLQDLGYPPQLRAPQVVEQPQPYVQVNRPDALAMGQLISSLGEFNKSLQSYGQAQYDKALDMAPDQAIKMYQEAKAQTEKSIQDYVSQSLITEGANPKVRQLTYNLIGERMAVDGYNTALFGKLKRAATEENPENPDDLIAETRKEFLEKLGDNMFIRSGAERIMVNAENQFRTNARSEQDRVFEQTIRSNVGYGIQQTIEQSFGNPDATDKDKAEGVNHLFEYLQRLRTSGVSNPHSVFLTNLATATESMAQKQQFAEAREFLDMVDARGLSDAKGNGLGTFGSREDAKDTITKLRVTLENRERAYEEKNEADATRAYTRKRTLGADVASNIISQALADNSLFDPALDQKVREAVEQTLPADIPGGNGAAILEALSVLNSYRASNKASDPNAILSFEKAMDSGDIETAKAILDGPSISADDKVKLNGSFVKQKNFAQMMTHPTVSSALSAMHRSVLKATNAVDSNGEEVLDDLTGERQALLTQSLGDFRAQLRGEIKASRTQHPDMDNETFSDSVLPGLVAKTQEKLMGTIKRDWDLIEKRQGFGEVDTGGKPLSLSKSVKTPKTPFFGSLDHENKVQAISTIADSVGRALEQSGGDLSVFDDKSKSVLAALSNLKRDYWPEVRTLGRSIAQNPEAPATQVAAYFNIRNRFGYTQSEVLSGTSSEGVPLPLEEWQKKGLAFTTPMFGSMKEFQDTYNSYTELSKKLQEPGITPEATKDLEFDEAAHPLTRMAEKLGLTNERAVGAFIRTQAKILRSLGGTEPEPMAPASSTAQTPTPDATITESESQFMSAFNNPPGLTNWVTQSNQILEHRDNMRKALFAEMAVTMGVTDQRLGGSVFVKPAWKVVADDISTYSKQFSSLPKEQQQSAYRAAISRTPSANQAPFTIGR